MKEIKGKSAVVTGAGGGIGRAIALELAKNGVNIMVTDIDEDAIMRVAEEGKAYGVESIGRKVDVSSKDEMFALAEAAYEAFGSVEILVNNAGVTLRPYRAHWDTSYKDWKWLFDVNFGGVLNGHLAFVPKMLQTPGEKHIVNTSSMAALYDIAGHAAYSATKAAVDGLSNSAREELKLFDIGVSILHPGAVRTRISTSARLMNEDQRKAQESVKSWAEYAGANAPQKPNANNKPEDDPAIPETPFDYINCDNVGKYVLDGIMKNKPHIMTHPLPEERIKARFDGIVNAVPDYDAYR
ncbi:MAG: SDR family NAD(P)-dependent oxidoreductase [Clostridia bacterium]|nr:SDR family NAD(P)-dependent oxidoreductase [Clostridia bacterium]